MWKKPKEKMKFTKPKPNRKKLKLNGRQNETNLRKKNLHTHKKQTTNNQAVWKMNEKKIVIARKKKKYNLVEWNN